MARSAWQGLIWAGLLTGAIAGSFLGCYASLKGQSGSCEDDGNPCTNDTCDANGKPNHIPVEDATDVACFLGENEGVCRSGSCELNCITSMTTCKCSTKEDCPADTLCAIWQCTIGTCVSTAVMEGMTADPLQPGDCQKKVCQGGALKIVDDPADTPTDVKGDCQDPVCEAGVPKSMANDNDVPMTDMAGDCMKPACNAGTPGVGVDEQDPPAPTECSTFACKPDGTWTAANKNVGDVCSNGPMGEPRACDKQGMCASCMNKVDFDKCKMNSSPSPCPVKLCGGATSSSATDCQSGFLADGVCCDTTCTGECKSCNVAGMIGTCTNVPFYEVDNSYTDPVFMTPAKCDSVSRCNGMGKCLKIIGKGCTADADCISGKCAAPVNVCLGAKGEPCTNGANCISGVCNANGFCD